MSASAPSVATEKAASAWMNAKVRLRRLGPEIGTWLEGIEAVGESEEILLLLDRAAPSPCLRCEALVGQALLPLGYRGAKIVTERELASRMPR